MNKSILILFITAISLTTLANTPKVTVEEYIDAWKEVAINQMTSHKIPASITLAQGILESGFGNSLLAKRANNHFGIKCHDWTGKKFFKDDDAKNECFRKYKNAAQSYEDHSEFLTSRSRYAFLFDLKITDYKAWSKGLKSAGYATNPKYANELIRLIEKYDLHQYDLIGQEIIANKGTVPTIEFQTETETESITATNKVENNTIEVVAQTQSVPTTQHEVYINENRTKYVIAQKHDTFYRISKEFGVSLNQLSKWNDFPPNQDVLKPGDKIYIMPKSRKAMGNLTKVTVKNNQTLSSISQEYGIQLQSLMERNQLSSPNVALNDGAVIYLR